MYVQSLQLYLTLCDSIDCSLLGSSVHGVLQARILEWVAMSPPGDLHDPGIKPRSSTLQEDSLPSEPPEKPVKFLTCVNFIYASHRLRDRYWDHPHIDEHKIT